MIQEGELISVIMPAYNAEETLCTAIDSVLAQTYSNLELVVVNDCSTDKTLDILKRYSEKDLRVRVISNDVNSGVSKTRHRAVKEAKGEWLAFLDSDDAWVENKLEVQIKLMKEKNAQLVFSGSQFMNEDGELINWILHVPEQIQYKRLLKQNLISNSSALVQKSLYQEYEALGDGMHEDFACWLRILNSGIIAYGLDQPLLIYRLSSNSKSGNKLKAAKMNWKTYRYVGLNVFSAGYYMIWYTIKGLLKYKHLTK